MSLRVEDNVARLEGVCGLADAEPLHAALGAGRATAADASACREMHAAVAQTIMRFGVAIAGEAADPFLRDHVLPALQRRAARARNKSGADGLR